jgi:hypothetical protein
MTKRFHYGLWAWAAGGVALLVSAATFFIVRSQGPEEALSTATLVAQAVLSLAAIPFFIRARRHFREKFRNIYVLLGCGIGLLGLAQLQTPLVVWTDFLFWVDSGLIGVLFLTSTILIFLSMRQFARALHLKTHWTSLRWVGIVAVAVAAAAGATPLLPGVLGDAYSPVMAFSAWNATLALLASLLVSHIARTISGIYATALERLNVALSLLAFSSVQYIVLGSFLTYDSWFFAYGIINISFIATAALFLWAGVAFNFIGESNKESNIERPTSLNIITYVASLASNQAAIDDILDGVRQISATLVPGEVPDEVMQHELAAIYLQLEEYLIDAEKLQDFSTKTLRARVEATLGLSPTDPTTFWPLITGRAFDGQQTT